jgi:pimeloyl-ACP methyl ester carboxylesterase
MTTQTHRTVTVQDIPIDVTEIGSGTPIVLIHGWSADHRYMIADWEPNFGKAAPWHRIYFDLPGHGSTPAPDWLTNQTQMLDIIRELLKEILDDKPFALVGNSYGGYLVLGLVRSMPSKVLGAALIVPDLPDDLNQRLVPQRITIRENLSFFDELAADEEWIPAGLVEHYEHSLPEIRRTDMPAYRIANYPFLERLNASYVLPSEIRSAKNPFNGPSLIALGHQDATVGYERQVSLLAEFPRATMCVADLAGHYLGRVERPKIFSALITDWLERLSR